MQVNANYHTPIVVNGYLCRNCTDVENAKKHIDPAHPKSGPFNIDARNDPTRVLQQSVGFSATPGAPGISLSGGSSAVAPSATGSLVDVTA